LGWHVFDREIVESIAADAKVRQHLVLQLDEKTQNLVHEAVQRLLRLTEGASFGVPEYHESLLKTVSLLAARGKAIIVGRGANFVLQGGNGLRVRIAASVNYRIERMSREWGLPASETRARLEAADAEKREFIRQHFRSELGDLSNYDVSFCMDHLSTAEVTAAILGIMRFPPAVR
jgi:cytidylate kinase